MELSYFIKFDILIFSDNYINLGGSRVLTAAHCLYKLDDEKLIEGHPVGVSVFTGYNNGNYDEVSSATSIKLPAEYINTLANQYDFGVIDLADDLSSSIGVLDLEVATNRNVKIGGYPADLGQRQYIMSGPATLESNGRLHYTIDTFGGQSGAPILDNVNNRIIGVHSAGYRDLDLNLGAALDSIKILFIKSP